MYRLWYPRGFPKDPSTLSLTEDLKKKNKFKKVTHSLVLCLVL